MEKPPHPLRTWRKGLPEKLTLAQLSERISTATVNAGAPNLSDIENWNKTPSLALACRLEEITGIAPREFLRPAGLVEEVSHG